MKVAVSIPEDIFAEADQVAKRLSIPRSELYARALKRYLEQLRGDELTSALNNVYSERRAEVDPVLSHLQLRSLPREDW